MNKNDSRGGRDSLRDHRSIVSYMRCSIFSCFYYYSRSYQCVTWNAPAVKCITLFQSCFFLTHTPSFVFYDKQQTNSGLASVTIPSRSKARFFGNLRFFILVLTTRATLARQLIVFNNYSVVVVDNCCCCSLYQVFQPVTNCASNFLNFVPIDAVASVSRREQREKRNESFGKKCDLQLARLEKLENAVESLCHY